MKRFVFRILAAGAVLALAVSCASVPETEGKRLGDVEKRVNNASGSFADQQAALQASAPTLESAAGNCLRFTSTSPLLQSSCYLVSATSYSLLGQLVDPAGEAALKAINGMRAVTSAAGNSHACGGPPADSRTQSNCNRIALQGHALQTRIAAARIGALAREAEPSAEDLANALGAFEDGIQSGWPLMSAIPGAGSEATDLKVGMLCGVEDIRNVWPARIIESDDWPRIGNARHRALGAGAKDLNLPLCGNNEERCVAACENAPDGSECLGYRVAAAERLCREARQS